MSKFMRGILILSILIFAVGIFCMTPNAVVSAKATEDVVSTVEDENETVNAQSSSDITASISGYTNILDEINVNTMSLSTTSKYGHSRVYQIKSANDLAYVSYMVSGGNSEYINGVYSLESDIDLSGKLWTPIGMDGKSFNGIFYGNRHVIRNVTIAEASLDANSNSYAGLFGNIYNASICDVILEGNFVFPIARMKGALVGNATSSEIINCYDLSTKVSIDGGSFNSIGTISNTYIFRGGSINGKYCTHNDPLTTLTYGGTASTGSGYVAFYNLNDGEGVFRRANTNWYEQNTVRVLINTSLNPSIYTPKNNLYTNKVPVLRENAGATDIYPLRQGYKATIPLANRNNLNKENAFITTITYTEAKTVVRLRHGYGGRQSDRNWEYDQTFASFFSEYPNLKQRVGYDFEGLYSETAGADGTFDSAKKVDDTGNDYKKAYPVYDGYYYFNWTAQTGKAFNVRFAIANDEGSAFEGKDKLINAVGNGFYFFDDSGELDDTSASRELKYQIKAITSGTRVSFWVCLASGYHIKNLDFNDALVTIDDGNEGTFKANVGSGIYTNFINETGKKLEYSADSSRNNDSYSKVGVTASFDGIGYDIFVDNIVGTTGEIIIVLEREEVGIDLTPDFVEADQTFDYQWTLKSGMGRIEETEVDSVKKVVLYVKVRETPVVELTTKITTDSSGVILKYQSHSGMQTGPTNFSKTDFSGIGEYYRTWEITLGVVSSGGHLKMLLGYLKSYVSITSVDENGEALDPIENEKEVANLGTSINSSAKYLTSTGHLILLNAPDSIVVSNNGFYYATKIVVNGGEYTNYEVGLTLADDKSQSTYNSTTIFTKAFENEGLNYSIVVHYARRTFYVEYQYFFKGPNATEYDICVSNTEQFEEYVSISPDVDDLYELANGTVINITLTLTDAGKGLLYLNSVGVNNTTGEIAGYGNNSISEVRFNNGSYTVTFTLGTYDSTIEFYFEFRKVELKIEKLWLAGSANTATGGRELSGGLKSAFTETFSFSMFKTDSGITLVSPYLVGNIGSLSILSRYYMLGWYLSNGNVVEKGNYQNILTNSLFIADMIASGKSSANTESFVYSSIRGLVQQRKVKVTTTTGSQGYGQFYLTDKSTIVNQGNVVDAGTVTHGAGLTISPTTFYNLGYTFAGWSVPANSGSLAGNVYSISDANWYAVFRKANDGSNVVIDDNGYQAWNSFSDNDKETRSVMLTATWEIIEYSVNIDDVTSATLKIGDAISYTTDKSKKDGQANYTIGGTANLYSSVDQGKVVTGYKVSHGSTVTIDGGANSPYGEHSLTPANFLAFIEEACRFSQNSSDNPIKIITLREAGSYKIYLDASTKGYYSYTYNASKLSAYGGIESGVIYINVTFGAVPVNLTNAIANGAVIISRTGYSASGWALSDAGAQSTVFDATAVYNYARNINIVPKWNRTSESVLSVLNFASDVGDARTFYLTNSHDVINGNFGGSVVDAGDLLTSTTLVLNNGEKVTGYGFIVSFGGSETTYAGQTTLNIDLFKKAGVVSVKFYIDIEDTLNKSPKIKYQAVSGQTEFSIAKNEIVFFGHDLHSVYNGTTEFVSATEDNDGVENEFGAFLYKYDWKGTDLTSGKSAVGVTSEWFNNFEISGDVNAGSGKSLKLALNLNKFGSETWTDIFANVQSDASGYYTILANELTIEKAKITLSFPEGSAYYIDGVQAIVYRNAQTKQITVGSQSFEYNYSAIQLKMGTPAGEYIGQKDYDVDSVNFVVYGLKVNGTIIVTEDDGDYVGANFEWNIDDESKFTLYDSADAIQLKYNVKYLSAIDGNLVDLTDSYDSKVDTLEVSEVYIDGIAQTYDKITQIRIFSGNNIVMSVAGNKTNHLVVYVNGDMLASINLEFKIKVNYANSTSRSTTLFPLAFNASNKAEDYVNVFDSDDAGKIETTIKATTSLESETINVVLTDTIKVILDYNGGKVGENASDTIYVSDKDGVGRSAPKFAYSGIKFAGYTSPQNSKLYVSVIGAGVGFSTSGGGKTETLKAKWNFESIDATLKSTSVVKYASENGINLGLNELMTISSPELFSNKTYSLTSGGKTYKFNLVTNNFEIKNDDGYALATMSGEYTLSLTFTFSDGVQSLQQKKQDFKFNLRIEANIIDVAYNGGNLTFNNTNQAGSVNIDFTLNGSDNGRVALSGLSQSNTISSLKAVYISATPSINLTNAGTYTIAFNVVSEYQEIYKFVGNTTSKALTIIVGKYEIKLADYNSIINISKVFGGQDPNPISQIIKIAENSNDEVAIAFNRENGEAIGFYALSFKELVNSDDRVNYSVNTDGFDADFRITVPGGNLQVQLNSNFAMTYNGYALNVFENSYNGTNYTLTATAGSENFTITYDLYYLNGGSRVEIPTEEKASYVGMIEFSSNASAGVGTYTLSVALTTAGAVWSGVDIVNTENAKIIVSKRIVTVSAFEKVFNQSVDFIYNNKNTSSNTATLTLENVVTYVGENVDENVDEIVIQGKVSSANVGEVTIKEMSIINTATNNYTLVSAESLVANVVADDSTDVNATTTESTTFAYGQFTSTMTTVQISGLIPLTYNNGAIATQYITISNASIKDGAYSTGGYLNKGTFNVEITLASKNYTFGAERQASLTKIYTKVITVAITVEEKSITITNSTLVITKQYDGNPNVLAKFVNQAVNATGGYYTSTDILAGDVVTISSAVYSDREIGTGKIITLSFANGDSQNYTILQNVKGSITKTTLTFNKNGATITFVDGVKDFGNSSAKKIDYTGVINSVISVLNTTETFLTRAGYTQTGWKYNGKLLTNFNSDDKETFLQDAVDQGTSGITLDAVWQINTYTVKIIDSDHSASSVNEKTVNYYDSIDSVVVSAEEGYTFEGVTADNESNAEILIVGSIGLSDGEFSVNTIIGDITITIKTEEITVKIIIEYNAPSGFSVSTEDANWKTRERIVKYTELSTTDLPVLKVNKANTYDFSHWTLGGNVNTAATIWERIGGSAITSDNVDPGFTFVANWTEAEIFITINASDKANVTVKNKDGNVITEGAKGFAIHFRENLSIEIAHDDWYKWTDLSITGDYLQVTGNSDATNSSNGAFTIEKIESALIVDITTEAISISFTTSYTTPDATTIAQANGAITGTYTADSSMVTMADVLSVYTAQAGTYRQSKWVSSGKNIAFTDSPQAVITLLYGSVPTEDISLALLAEFEGLEYTVTFEKGTESANSSFLGDDAGSESAERKYVYGSVISNIPVLKHISEGKEYLWTTTANEIFADGKKFTTSLANADCTLTITAQWANILFKVNVTVSTNADKVLGMTSDSDIGGEIQVILGASPTITFTLATGYELDNTNTVVSVGNVLTTLEITSSTIKVVNVQEETSITVVVKAKDYILTINESGFETLSKTEFAVSYDSNISAIFNGETFERAGYVIEKLSHAGTTFATYSLGAWTISETYAPSGIYSYDGNITLDTVWKYNAGANFITITVNSVDNVYYNATEQTLATASFTLTSGETFTLSATFDNGEKVKEVYYMLNGSRTSAENDFSLVYTNHISNATLYMVAVIEDVLTGTTHEVKSTQTTVSLNKTDVLIKDSNITSFYTGSSMVELVAGATYGELYFHDNVSTNRELEVAKVELVDSNSTYYVGTHKVKYYFNTLVGFVEENYTGLTKEGGFYTLTTDNMNGEKVMATVTPAPAKISISGMGYENGYTHQVTDAEIIFPDYVVGAEGVVNSMQTKETSAKEYNALTDFDIDYSITNLSGDDISTNFTVDIEGSFTIRSRSYAYELKVDSKYFAVDSFEDNSNIVKVICVQYDSKMIVINTALNYMKDGELIFSIAGNGTNGISILVTKGKTINLSMEVDGDMAVLDWVTTLEVDDALSSLQALSEEGERRYSQNFTTDAEITAVLTDYKAILQELGAKGGNQGYAYIKLGQTITLAPPEAWTGFAFVGWDAEESGLTISGNQATLPIDENILASSIRAIWELASPTATTKTFVATALFDGGEIEIEIGDILVSGIENRVDGEISYAYEFLLGATSLSTTESFKVAGKISSSGTYTIKITASKDGYVSKTAEYDFGVEIKGIQLSSVAFDTPILIFQNRDFMPEINVTLTLDDGETKTLKLNELSQTGSPYCYFTGASEIKNAGAYNLAFNIDEDIFDLAKLGEEVKEEYIFTVAKAELVLTQAMVPANQSKKLIGSADPSFKFNVTMFAEPYTDTVEISLTRESGENQGEYAFITISSTSENYDLSLDPAGVIFTIEQASDALKVKFDSMLTVEYTGASHTFTTLYDSTSGKWKMSVGSSTTTLSLAYGNGTEFVEITGNLYVIALENISFSFASAVDAGVHNANAMLYSGAGNFANYIVEGNFEITTKGLTVTGITKVFDRSDLIEATESNLVGVVVGDAVELSGKYSTKTVGTNIALVDLALSGEDCGNYHIINTDAKGNITPLAVTNSSVSIVVTSFEYGQIDNTSSVAELESLFEKFNVSIDGNTSDLEKGFVSVTSITFDSDSFATSGMLKKGSQTATIVLSSTNFTGLESSYEVELTINQKEIDLSSLTIEKDYDETVLLPSGFSSNIDAYIIVGDKVEIDLTNSAYEDAGIGEKKVRIVIKGDDSENYAVIDNVYGTINAFSIIFNVNAEEENDSLVSDGAFVEDGLSAVVNTGEFRIAYPNSNTAQSVIDSLTLPSRPGYTPTGWKYFDGTEYISLTQANIFALLESIALDESIVDKSTTIYPVWEINYNDVSVSGDHTSEITLESVDLVGDAVNGYKLKYFSNLTVKVVGERGYKVKSYVLSTGNVASRDFSDVGNNSSTASLLNVSSAISIEVVMESIKVTFAIDFNIPQYTARIDSSDLVYTFAYSDLASLGQSDLGSLAVTAGTYSFTNYTYSEGKTIDSMTLAEVVDELYVVLENDATINLTANWTGETYLVAFDLNGGTLESGSLTMTATYGTAFAGSFPTVTKAGQSVIWKAPDGRVYNSSDILQSVGTLNGENKWTITIKAEWQNDDYTLTFVIEDKITVEVNEFAITSGQTYTLTYGEDLLTISVTSDLGYDFNVNTDQFYGSLTVEGGNYIAQNLTANSIIKFEKLLADNTLTLTLAQVETFVVSIDGTEVTASESIIAKTESEVEIVFTAKKGYEFADANIAFLGNGTFAKTISADKNILTIVWSAFISDAQLSVTAIASDNVVTIQDASAYFLTLTLNGQSVSVSGGTFTAKTGSTIAVAGVLKYGYENASIVTGSTLVKEGSEGNTFNNGDKYFHYSASLEGFDEDFAISFSATERTYAFEILVADGQETCGEITSDSPQYVKFGEKLTLAQSELRYDYRFFNWSISGEVFSTNESDEITIDESQKSFLESVNHGDMIIVYANYEKSTVFVSFSASNYGFYQVVQNNPGSLEDEVLATITAGTSASVEILLGYDVILNFTADKGYEVGNVNFDGTSITLADYGYTLANPTVVFNQNAETPIMAIEVTFMPSAIRVSVQAGTSIRYEEFLGTDAGGSFYATNYKGERLSDSVYLENNGKLIIGADYQLASFTDVRIYFVAEVKVGFTFSVTCDSVDVVISQAVYDGKTVYSFGGIKEDFAIKALFVAKENNVKVMFALEGERDRINAGTIAVDASSSLVSASPNRGEYLDIAVATSATLKLDVYSAFSYNLLTDKNGYLAYEIVYESGAYDEINVERVVKEDEYSLGYTYSSSMEIVNVNANATIYIYVVPKGFTLRFAVSDTEFIVLGEEVRYGERFNFGSLSDEEYEALFPYREGYTFTGYYTYPLGQGEKYVDADRNIIKPWYEDGYVFDGLNYIQESNFDPFTNTITLYSGWVYDKAIIEVKFTPEIVSQLEISYDISSVITNFNEITAWVSQSSKWYAEILIGSSLNFKAVDFNGYHFVSWEVSFNDGDFIAKPASFTLGDVQGGTYLIKAVYNPTYRITIESLNNSKNEGGKVAVLQDGEVLAGASFDKDKYVTLRSTPDEGYTFLYWIDVQTGARINGIKQDDGTTTYTYNVLLQTPLQLKAIFKGKAVSVNFDYAHGGAIHDVREVTVNGKSVSFDAGFNACVGDEIKVFVRKTQGYGFNFIGAPMFEIYDDTTGYYVFSYTIRVAELTALDSETYALSIRFEAIKEKLNLMFNILVDMAVDEKESGKAGRLEFTNAKGEKFIVGTDSKYQITYGDRTELQITSNNYYRLSYILLRNPDTFEITSWLDGNVLVINQDLIDLYFAKDIIIEVYYERLVWTMAEFRASSLIGEGTEANPFVITTEEEFAYVAYLVNNGMLFGDVAYADCWYVLKADLDFRDKYWEPIGTVFNPFNGTFDLGGYAIKNVTHYTKYTNPNTSYGGLFWFLGDDAKIMQDSPIALIFILVAIVVLFVIVIIMIIRMRRKKKQSYLDDIANG